MRNTLILILTCSAFQVGAQSLTLSQNELYMELGEYTEYGVISLTNAGSDTVEVALGIDLQCYDADDSMMLQVSMGLDDYFPVNSDMIFGDVQQYPSLVLLPGESSSVICIHQYFAATFGSEWMLSFFDRNNPDNSVDLAVFVGVCDQANGVGEWVNPVLEVGLAYPSPSASEVTIPLDAPANGARLVVDDQVGHRVQEIILDERQTEVRLNVSDWLNGVYFYGIMGGDMRSAVRSLVVAH